MNLSNDTYIPALSWRMAEYQALFRLSNGVKSSVVPLISVPEIGFDFEKWAPTHTLQEHLEKFVGSYPKKWGEHFAWIRLHQEIEERQADDGRHVFDFIFDGLRVQDAKAIPALSLAANDKSIRATNRTVCLDRRGIGIIIRLEDIMAEPTDDIRRLSQELGVGTEETDLIIDLGSPNYEPYEGFASALIKSVGRMRDIAEYRSLIIVGTSIPKSFRFIARGTDEIPRHDWLFYRSLLGVLPDSFRHPLYGDYTIVHPASEARDMRMLKPAGKLVYATPNSWRTRKGGAFRDDREQMHSHCAEIIHDAAFQYKGSQYSYGDEYIASCASHAEGPSNLSRWKQVGINHHITLTVQELANFAVES